MLARRLRNYDPVVAAEKSRLGRELLLRLAPQILCPAGSVEPHAFWVFPIMPADPQKIIDSLFEAGFDATQGQSLVVVQPPAGRSELTAADAESMLARILFLPFYSALPVSELERMAEVIKRSVQT